MKEGHEDALLKWTGQKAGDSGPLNWQPGVVGLHCDSTKDDWN